MRPIGIDLFAGAGGMSLGFEQAGFDVAAAVEIDPIHCAVHKFNFPYTAVICGSVVGLTAQQIRAQACLGNAQIACVFGGAPCQGFSLIGHRVLDDPRNGLVLEFVRLVAELEAETFVFENVKGLTIGKHRQFLDELVNAFDECGYDVRLPWEVLNAANYGVPQSRERLFLLGSRKGSPPPTYPKSITNISGGRNVVADLPFGPTCADALADLPNADDFPELFDSDEHPVSMSPPGSQFAAEMRCLTNDAWHYGYRRRWRPNLLTSSARTQHTIISRTRFARTSPGTVEPISRFYKLPSDGVSNTLRAGTDGARGAFTSPRPIHFKWPRCVTVREMARLHGFPDWFRLHATKWHGARQIGNAVAPPMARAIAAEVVRTLGVTPVRPKIEASLNDQGLLYLELAHAAAHFGVPKPNSRRDRKSGARKRKQIEIEAELTEDASYG